MGQRTYAAVFFKPARLRSGAGYIAPRSAMALTINWVPAAIIQHIVRDADILGACGGGRKLP